MPQREQLRRRRRERIRARRLGVTQHRHAFDAIVRSDDRLNWVVEGDSWFAYPRQWLLFGPNSNLIDQLFANWVGSGKVNALCLAANGDTAQDMFDGAQLSRLERVLDEHGGAISAVLLSAGGNDLLGREVFETLVRPNPAPQSIEGFLHLDRLEAVLDQVEQSFDRACASIAQRAPGATVYVHSYDIAKPADRPATFFGGIEFTGPWMFPALDEAQVPEDQWTPIVGYLIERFVQRLHLVQGRANVAVQIIDLRGQLVPGSEADWADEIHPSPEGFQKLAEVLLNRLEADFPRLS